jgi:hypothetical protein
MILKSTVIQVIPSNLLASAPYKASLSFEKILSFSMLLTIFSELPI